MTALDDRLIPRVASLVTKYGRAATYTVVTTSHTPGAGTTTETTATHSVIVTPPAAYTETLNELARFGDQETILAAQGLTFTPKPADRVTIGSDVWTLVSIQPILTGASVAVYVLQIRK